MFSPLLKGERDWYTRVGHSAGNWFSSIDRTSFGFAENNYRVNMNNVTAIGGGVTNAATNFAGTAGVVAGSIAIGMSATAATAVAGAGFLAAIAGPQIAVTAGVVGLAMLIKSAYSNREAAHKKLYAYVWNMVDDKPPTAWDEASLKEAAAAAVTLMDDGKNQIKLLGEKLTTAQNKFQTALAAMDKLNRDYDQGVLDEARLRPNRANARYAGEYSRAQDATTNMTRLKTMFVKEMKEGGAIFEYIRRLSHTGNYIQAPGIIALAMKQQLRNNYTTPAAGAAAASLSGIGDYFADVPSVVQLRLKFTELDKLYRKAFGMPAATP
jgi:hypothetical protein